MKLIYQRGVSTRVPARFLMLAHGRNFFLGGARLIGFLIAAALLFCAWWYVFRHVRDPAKMAVAGGVVLGIIGAIVYAGWWIEMRYDMMLRATCPDGITFIVDE